MKESFPGYSACLAMMREHDPLIQEDGFHWLLPGASEHLEEFIEDFRREEGRGLKCWLLELIGEARSPKAFALLCEQLHSSEVSLRDWAIRGLQHLDTNEARQALFDAEVDLEAD